MNNFLNTEPLSLSQKQLQANNLNIAEHQQSSGHQASVGLVSGSMEQMKQIEDRKKVVAAIYLNSMTSNKVASSVEAREKHSRRRQSDGDQQESGPVLSSGINRSQIYGAEKSAKIVPI